jgi:hypothetical protein
VRDTSNSQGVDERSRAIQRRFEWPLLAFALLTIPAIAIEYGDTGQPWQTIGTVADEIYRVPRSWAEKAYPNLVYYNQHDRGGHFAAWEQPQLLSEDVRATFRSLR